jgi:cytochrome c-type biogenesis protein
MMLGVGSFGGGRTPFAYALITGIITAFNPCGFAMLPAYVSYFVGQNADGTDGLAKRLTRAVATALLVTAGFMTVFGAIGLVATGFLTSITQIVPYVSMVVGVVLATLGVAMVRGFEPTLSFLKVSRARSGHGYRSMYLYGLSYAVVSLSCGFLGFFSAVIASTREKSFASSMGVYVAFTAGMGMVLVVLSFAVALAQQAFIRGMRKVLPHINRVSGALLTASGLYVAYYGFYEWKTVIRNERAPEGPVAWVQDWSNSLKNVVDRLPLNVVLIALVVLVGAGTASVVLSRETVTESNAESNLK